jgi:glutamyl-tRNA synthetase
VCVCSVPVTVIGGANAPSPGQVTSQSLPRHKKNPEVGQKTTYYSSSLFVEQADAASFAQDEEVTLMDWGNAFVRSIKRTAEGKVESIEVELNLEGDFKKTKKKVTWLASPEFEKGAQGLVPVELVDYDYLITKKKLEEDDSVEELINPKTEYRFVLCLPFLPLCALL